MATTREGSAAHVHPTYSEFAETWRIQKDLYEGTGGFMDPKRPYLIAHPREWLDHSVQDATSKKWSPNPNPTEPSPKLLIRRKLVSYVNLAATILDQVAGALFLQSPVRTFGAKQENTQIAAWWDNVDGQGKDMTAYMKESWVVSGVFGHVVNLMEKAVTEAVTAADQQLPILCRYTPLDVIDWLDNGEGKLLGVKLLEVAPRTSFEDRTTLRQRIRVRVIDEQGWRVYGSNGQILAGVEGQGNHGFGMLPVEYLYSKRRLLTPFVGKSIIGDPYLHLDLYNLGSERRELLRNQTFAILNVPIGPEGSVQSEQEKMGQQSGTSNVLITSEPAQYISPSGDNVKAYHDTMDWLARIIYRLASAPWEGDSKDAESADSREIKRADQEQVLKTYALEMQGTEWRLLRLAYKALYGEHADAKMEADQPQITYPQSFTPPDMGKILDNAAAAVGLDLGETATKELRKRVARFVLPDARKELIQQIDEEIQAADYKSEAEKAQEQIDNAAKRFAAGRAA